ncbi:MAG TPA: diguanylate cyclase, partial [Burkholderiaceae bacterium]|nr:diguanylate cyclase [Burkholderiaceae bacterium]
NLAAGDAISIAPALAACNLLEVMLAWRLMRAAGADLHEASLRSLVGFVLCACIIAPTASAACAATVLWSSGLAEPLSAFGLGWTSNALGMAISAPAAATILGSSGTADEALSRQRRNELIAAAAIAALVALALFAQPRQPPLFLMFPLLLLVAFRTGFAGGSLVLIVLASLSVALTLAGHGPFVAAAESPRESVLTLQLFLLAAGTITLPVATVLAARRRLVAEVHENEARFRTLAEYSTDLIMRLTVSGRRLYVSPAAAEMLGWEPRELLASQVQLIHPEERHLWVESLARLADGERTCKAQWRMLRKDGSYVWVETSSRRIERSDGEVELVSTSHDITWRRQAEQELLDANRRLARLAATDALTGVPNRHQFDQALDVEWRRAMRGNQSLSLLMIDVDYFKRYNDSYGHPAGDACLRTIASALRHATMRPGDLVARYGGEEFVVLLPATDLQGAVLVADRVHDSLRRRAIPHRDHPSSPHVTVSIGVATVQPAAAELRPPVLVVAADAALYRAKRAGRARTECATPGEAEGALLEFTV